MSSSDAGYILTAVAPPGLSLTRGMIRLKLSSAIPQDVEFEISCAADDFSAPVYRNTAAVALERELATPLVADGRNYFARARGRTQAGRGTWSATSTLQGEILLLDFAEAKHVLDGVAHPSLSAALATPTVEFVRASRAGLVDAEGMLHTFAADTPSVLPGVGAVLFGRAFRNHLTMPFDRPPAKGALPAGWSILNSTGVEAIPTVAGYKAGFAHVDLRLRGTAKAGVLQILFQDERSLAAAAGETWTASACVQLVSGRGERFSHKRIRCVEVVDGRALVGANVALSLQGTTLWATRAVATRLFTQRKATHVGARLSFGVPAGGIDVTLRIAQPQLEQAAAASPVPVLGRLRAADRLTLRPGLAEDRVLVLKDVDGVSETRSWTGEALDLTFRDGTTIARIKLALGERAIFDSGTSKLSWSRS